MQIEQRNQKSRQALCAWLEMHPEIESRLERMMKLTGSGSTNSVDEFEQQMLNEIDNMGQDLLRNWLFEKELGFRDEALKEPKLRKHSKKNSKSIRS